MVSNKLVMVAITMLLSGCMFEKQYLVCEAHPDICEQAKANGSVNIIITLTDTADKQSFADALGDQGGQVHKVFDVTPQLLVEVDIEQLVAIYHHTEIENIQLDQFNSLLTP